MNEQRMVKNESYSPVLLQLNVYKLLCKDSGLGLQIDLYYRKMSTEIYTENVLKWT